MVNKLVQIVILGGGLSGLSLALYLQNNPKIESIIIIEKEEEIGGLCRSFQYQSIFYDIGPHIIFSKDQEILKEINDLLGENRNLVRRSNKIIHQKRFIQYPFENDLSKLPKQDLEYCVNAFMNNPYENYPVQNMLQFFLKNFGEGITNTYLRPYNEKIWKFDPSFMDTQMVDRIPKPPKEDIIKSAQGQTIEGYTHQLYFSYPKTKGISSLIKAIKNQLSSKVSIKTNCEVNFITKQNQKYTIKTNQEIFTTDLLVSTIPIPNLITYYPCPTHISSLGSKLIFNSLIIGLVNLKVDRAGENFVFTIADKKIIFHRIAKLDFLGNEYHKPDSVTYLVEIAYRKGDLIDKKSDSELANEIKFGLKEIGFMESENEINFINCQRFEHCYIVYDINHRQNLNTIIQYFQQEGIYLHGRFGEWEYINMDTVLRKSKILAEKITKTK